MRDPNRITEIIKTLEEVWKSNPDFRLGQLLTVAARPKTPHPRTFNIEDDEILLGLKSIGQPQNKESIPFWERYPDVSKCELSEISIKLIEEYIQILKLENFGSIITASKLMELNGAPTLDNYWMSKQEERILRIRKILAMLEAKNMIRQEEIGYKIEI